MGQTQKASDALTEAIRLNPDSSLAYGNLVDAYIDLGRIDEAKSIVGQAVARKKDGPGIHQASFRMAYAAHDTALQQKELDWFAANDQIDFWHARFLMASAAGKLRDATARINEAIEAMRRAGYGEVTAMAVLDLAEFEVVVGQPRDVHDLVAEALKVTRSREAIVTSAGLLAWAGFAAEAQPLLDRAIKEYPPSHTFANAVSIPTVHAAFARRRGDPAVARRAAL